MIIKINGKEIELSGPAADTIGKVLEGIVNSKFCKDEFITDISLNGEALPESEFATVTDKAVAEVESLELKTDNPRDLSLRTLEGIGDFLDNVITSLGKSADMFRMEDATEANKYFLSCVEGLQTFVDVLNKIKNLNKLDFGAITFDGMSIGDKETELLKVFNNLHDIQEKKDWISLADVLEYELTPLISAWREIVPIIIAEIEKDSDS